MKKQVFNYVKKQIMTDNTEKSKHVETIIRNHVVWSMGAGLIPILIADIFAVSALQLDMIRQMCKVYEVDFKETQGKAIVTSLTSTTLARLGAGSFIKLIPGIGSFIGGATVSVFAGASTYALGQVFKRHFESGGTILDFDPDRLKKAYKELFEKGKTVAKEWNEQAKKGEGGFMESEPEKAEASAEKNDILNKLKDLGDLHQKGVISDEEFKEMKKKLLEKFGTEM